MCTYATATLAVRGNAKGGEEWDRVRDASVYLDHPVSFPATHSLNIDLFSGTSTAPERRVALELDPRSARALALAIIEMIDSAPPGILEEFEGDLEV